jgi:four helix bundle protein
VLESYRLAGSLPRQERYELAAQIRRAAVSIPANIAEGNGRLHRGDYVHHISIARGSLMELDTHFEIARSLGYIRQEDLAHASELMDHISRMLMRLATRLRG